MVDFVIMKGLIDKRLQTIVKRVKRQESAFLKTVQACLNETLYREVNAQNRAHTCKDQECNISTNP